MPDNSLSALYPQPPQQQQNSLLADPLRTAEGLTLLQRQQMALQGQRAFGQIYAKHVTPDGVDVPAILKEAASDPNASLVLPEYTTSALAQHGQMISNAQADLGLHAAQNKGVMDFLSSLDPNKSTAEDVRNGVTTLKRLYPSMPAATLYGISHMITDDPQGLAHGIVQARNIGIGPAGISGRVVGPPTAGGAPTTMPTEQANYAGALPSGLAPGEQPLLEAPAQRAAALQASASTSPQYHADLENLKTDSKIMDNLGGPTVEVEKRLNQLSQRVAGFGITMTPDQLKATESFDKIANTISSNQARILGAATDAGRDMVLGSTPNTQMSHYGREGVIDMLQGNQDFIDRARQLWFSARRKGAAAGSFDDFMHNLGNPADPNVPAMDPRVFQMARMSRDNQQKFLNDMDPDEVQDFERRYEYAIKQGWVKPLRKQ